MPQFNVEIESGVFEKVISHNGNLADSGALMFTDRKGEMVVIYAPGTWRTLTMEKEEA